MSRNLGDRSCAECSGSPEHIVLEEPPRPCTEKDVGAYWPDYQGLIVANARCVLCHTLYLAWVDWPGNMHRDRSNYWNRNVPKEQPFIDLSYRDSFNDEPSVLDLPVYEIERVVIYRRKPAPIHRYHEFHKESVRDHDKALREGGALLERYRWKGESDEALVQRLTERLKTERAEEAAYLARCQAELAKKRTLSDELADCAVKEGKSDAG